MLTIEAPNATISPSLPEIRDYSVFEFAKISPAENSRRFYRLAYQPSLWSPYCVVRTWGRFGSNRLRSLALEFEDEDSARKWLTRQLARRLKRGYLLLG